MVSQTDPTNQTTSFEYDKKGRVTKETDGEGYSKTYLYHAILNKVIEEKDKLNRITKYTYDSAGNILSKILPDGNVLSYTYDKMNHKLTYTDEKSITSVIGYKRNMVVSIL